jgi:hypothetical protein
VAEDVHEERVGTGGCIQFAAMSIVTGKIAPRGSMRFPKPTIPLRLPANALVGGGMEISVLGVVGLAE